MKYIVAYIDSKTGKTVFRAFNNYLTALDFEFNISEHKNNNTVRVYLQEKEYKDLESRHCALLKQYEELLAKLNSNK